MQGMTQDTPKISSLADEARRQKEAAAAVIRQPPKPMRWADLQGRAPPERVWRIAHWMGLGPMLLAGGGGIGKTLIAQTIATALAIGRNFVDEVTAPAKVLFWACEDDHDELWRRQVSICNYFGIRIADLDGKLVIEPRLGRNNTILATAFGSPTWTPVRDELREQVNDYAADVVMLDNIGQTYGGGENDRHAVTMFVNGLAGLTERPVTTMLLGHPAKAAGSEFSGSTAWENAVRMRWFLGTKLPDQKDDDAQAEDGVRYLAKRKTNYSVNDYRRLTFREGVLCPDAGIGGVRSYADQSHQEQARRVVLNGLRRLKGMAIPTTHAANSPAYLPRKILEMNLGEDFTRSDLVRAMNELLLAGNLEVGIVGTYDKGGKRTGLREVEKDSPK